LLLAMLAVDRGRIVGVGALVEELWGDRPPANPAAGLQNVVSRVRRFLAAGQPQGASITGP
jgi:DNA-binding SARP family transcriptional activator